MRATEYLKSIGIKELTGVVIDHGATITAIPNLMEEYAQHFISELTPVTPAAALKPFNIEAAKAGSPVVMRNGIRVKRFLAFDWGSSGYPILLSYLDDRGVEKTAAYTIKGEFNLHGSCDGGEWDLFMVPQTITRWINVYRRAHCKDLETGTLTYESAEMALQNVKESVIVQHLGAFSIEIPL